MDVTKIKELFNYTEVLVYPFQRFTEPQKQTIFENKIWDSMPYRMVMDYLDKYTETIFIDNLVTIHSSPSYLTCIDHTDKDHIYVFTNTLNNQRKIMYSLVTISRKIHYDILLIANSPERRLNLRSINISKFNIKVRTLTLDKLEQTIGDMVNDVSLLDQYHTIIIDGTELDITIVNKLGMIMVDLLGADKDVYILDRTTNDMVGLRHSSSKATVMTINTDTMYDAINAICGNNPMLKKDTM